MALVPLRTLLDHAAEHDYGVAAFNVNNMEQIQAIMEAARETEELTVEVKFQACNEKQCLAPKTAQLIGRLPVAAKGETVKKVNEKVFDQDQRKRERQKDA